MDGIYEARRDGEDAIIVLRGHLGTSEATSLHRALEEQSRAPGVSRVVLDFTAVEDVNTAAVGAVSLGFRRLASRGRALSVKNLRGSARAAFAGMPVPAPPAVRPRLSFTEELASRTRRAGLALLLVAELAVDVAWRGVLEVLRCRRIFRSSVVEQAVSTGVNALPIVGLLTFLVGVVLAFQGLFQLSQFGIEVYVADIVAVGMVREFGPLIAAVILAGRSGAAIAAELATMSVQQEIDALRAMGLDPVRLLVIPRMAALFLVQPALTVLATLLGLLGGMLVSASLGLSKDIYLYRIGYTVVAADVWIGVGKSFLFALLIGFISCFTGLRARGGPNSVGRATTSAVVASVFFIVVADSVVTTVDTLLRYG